MHHPLKIHPALDATWEYAALTALLRTVARHTGGAAEPAPSPVARDGVTGLMSRTALEGQAAAIFATARTNAAPVCVILVDVDDLKAINHRFGAAAGDAVLAHVAKLMALNIQPGVDLAGRLVGAEMALVLPEADFGWAQGFAERLRGSLANCPLVHEGRLIETSACFGVASITPGDACFADLLARARLALSAAKTGGPNLIRVAADQTRAAA